MEAVKLDAPTVFEIEEGTTGLYSATLVDEDGSPITADDLDSMTITLRDKQTSVVINERDAQPCLNEADVTVDGSGILRWQLTPADNVIVTPSCCPPGRRERHVLTLRWVFAGGRVGKFESVVDVRRRLVG